MKLNLGALVFIAIAFFALLDHRPNSANVVDPVDNVEIKSPIEAGGDATDTSNVNTKPVVVKDMISAQVEQDSKAVFSQYYEIISTSIDNYKETDDGQLIEAIFDFKIIHKNFDTDPDTVPFIKKAKEENDPLYQTYYDEYLQPKEMNMEIKATLDSQFNILYYRDESPEGKGDWVPFTFQDCIIK